MVTLNRYTQYGANRNILEITGLSSDEKPVESIESKVITNGSIFEELDTGKIFKYDEENKRWHSQKSSASSDNSLYKEEIIVNENGDIEIVSMTPTIKVDMKTGNLVTNREDIFSVKNRELICEV